MTSIVRAIGRDGAGSPSPMLGRHGIPLGPPRSLALGGSRLRDAATYGLLALVAWRSRLPLAARRAAAVAGIVLPILVGLSRIALGVHYPTDVLGGWLAGIALVALAATLILLTGAMRRDLPRPAPPGRRQTPGRE